MAGSILVYGETKVGKTLDVCNCFRRGLVLLAEPNGLSSVKANVGFEPAHVLLSDLNDPLTEINCIIDGLPRDAAGNIKDYTALIIDTGTELADRTITAYERSSRDPRQAYGRFALQFPALIRKLTLAKSSMTPDNGMWVVMICHEIGPERIEGKLAKGRPSFPGSKLGTTDKIPSMFSTVLRAKMEPNGERVYECGRSVDWYTGDRYGACAAVQEMDLRPIVFRMMNPGVETPEFEKKQIRTVMSTVSQKGI